MCDVKNCGKDYAFVLESGAMVCEDHAGPPKKYICKHCKVQVVSATNTLAIFGRSHGKHCPRRFK